jgi:hemolysin activation/secretion protein
LALLSAAAQWPVSAQVVSGGQSGTIRDETRPQPEPLSRPEAPLIQRIERPQGAADSAVRFRVARIRVEGSTVFDPNALAAITRAYEGKELTLAELRRAADEITALYGNTGHGLSFAYIPEQTIADGTVVIRVVEARIGRVEVRVAGKGALIGAERLKQEIEKRLSGLAGGNGPIRTADLERQILLIGDLGGLDARITVAPSATVDLASDIVVEVQASPGEAFLGVENWLRPDFGRFSTINSATGYSLAIPGDSLAYTWRTGLDFGALDAVDASYQLPVGRDGLMFVLSGSSAWTKGQQGLLGALGFEGREETASAGLRFPFLRSRRQNLIGSLEVAGINSRSYLLGTPITVDRIRTLTGQISYDWVDDGGASQLISIGLTQGVGGLGATSRFNPIASRTFGTPSFTSAQLRYFAAAPVGAADLRVEFQGEATFDGYKLAAVECSYGGRQLGQGYFPGAIGGDHCMKGSVEASHSFYATERLRLTPFIVGDFGVTRERGPLDIGEARVERAVSIGAGLKLASVGGLRGSAILAKPLIKRTAAPHDELHFFFTLGRSF